MGGKQRETDRIVIEKVMICMYNNVRKRCDKVGKQETSDSDDAW